MVIYLWSVKKVRLGFAFVVDYKDKGRMNALIISELDVLRRTCASEEAGVHKARQYAAAIKTIRGLIGEIKTMADVPTGKGTGIGEKIQEKIEEILATGSLASAERARATKAPDVLDVFQNIYGVGPKKAADLVAAGYTTLEALRAAAALPANAKLLTKNQRIGLQYYTDLLERIPRAEMDEHNAVLMARKPAALEGIVVGSYRRGRPDSGDIDMMICTRSAEVNSEAALRNYVKALQDAGYLKEVLALGPHKCLAICQLGSQGARRLDLLVTPPESFACSVFYFTGSDGFNVAVRALAKEKGFTLNEHGLFRTATGVALGGLKTERDIFIALGLQWKEPVERTGPEVVIVSASSNSSSSSSASATARRII
jgi:DNA polymerase/3'-5' exonuclease PolX